MGVRNWAEAQQLESEKESALKFNASYGYFNSTLFLGDFKKAMGLMADQWSRHYAPLGDEAKERLRARLTGHLILNPTLASRATSSWRWLSTSARSSSRNSGRAKPSTISSPRKRASANSDGSRRDTKRGGVGLGVCQAS